jgi:tetratricopeptide (TPR) repeat protein
MARTLVALGALLAAAAVATAPEQEPPRPDSRLPVSTLLREDVFAGFMEDDLGRFSRGEKNIDLLLEQRPKDKPELLAWKGGATLFRAVHASESGRPEEFQAKYRQALDLFAEAKALAPGDLGVVAVIGGTYVVFGDRLPAKEQRDAAWSEAYEAYRRLWRRQAPSLEQLPTHLRGELLGGLAQSAQRTGRTKEAERYLDKILTLLPGTPYEPIAKQWKKDPASATGTSITCLSCHAPGRLAVRRTALDKD